MLLQGNDEAVDDRTADTERLCDLGDRQAIGGLGHHLEHAQAAIEGLRGLGCHATNLANKQGARGGQPRAP